MTIQKTFTQREVIDLLKAKFGNKSVQDVAILMHVSRGYLYDVLSEKRSPGPSVLAYLNLEREEIRTVIYRRARSVRA